MEALPSGLVLLMFLVHLVCLTFQFGYVESTSNHSINASCIDTERKGLLDIKGALIDSANRLSSWTGRDCCSWDGITCDNITGVVKMLDLSNLLDDSFLGGKIHPSILNLEHLEYLDLYGNNFSGIPIPSFLGSLKNLRYLDLSDSKFGGEVPPLLGNLSKLKQLHLGDSLLYSFYSPSLQTIKSFKWISGLTSLDTLDFYNINMTESLDWLSSITMLPSLSSLTMVGCGLVDTVSPLVGLYLSPNSFTSSPPNSLCNLTSLISMDFSFNMFGRSFPLCLGNLTSLKRIYLQSNKLDEELPSDLGNLKQLTRFDLSDNYFKGPIPSSFGQLSMMVYLNLHDNHLYGTIPPTLLNLTKLESLDVSYNSLSGEIRESGLGELKSLQYLDLSKNQFLSFNASSQWIPPFQLYALNMDSVFVGTHFPSWLQSQTNIESIILKNSSISGSLPGWCGTIFSHIETFDVSNNFLTGHVPVFYLNHSVSSFVLKLANNHLTGNIPEELCNLQALNVLSLANNQLTGKILPCLGKLRSLQVLDLANNSLSGQIPYTFGNLGRLVVLHLNGNKLFGVLPSSLRNLTGLITLDLGNNQFRDLVHDWMGKGFSSLQYLRLQSNDFYGNIPVNLCQLPSLQVLNLADNNLVGTIPPCLGNLSMMLSDESGKDVEFNYFHYYAESLWNTVKGSDKEYSSNLRYVKSITLSGNNIHGKIPDELMDLKYLQNLNLSNNNLSGKIPERIDNLRHLESLDLSMNQLSGTIPQSLASIDALSYLNLSFNHLTGRVPSGNHFNTLNDPRIYEGNSGLCGKPLKERCANDSSENAPTDSNRKIYDDTDKFEFSWFYYGIGPGFAIGFLGVFYVLHLKKSWRHAYFRLVENACDKVRVTFAVRMSQFQRRFT